ncbi:helix-turn-helix transcriptional regulator [Ureibacillus massiliensis]|uniref:helix-turn-helix domain-containing protein n=1 Tax=Ureibacillus massiliensis TaxID=292806 RepID=UPI002E1C453A
MIFLKQLFHEQLQILRKERNWSLEELSKKTQIGIEKLSMYENGELVPSMQTILKLSNVLEVPASNLADGLKEN